VIKTNTADLKPDLEEKVLNGTAELPFTLKELKAAIPPHCYQPST
jgi:hypothetical protein